MDRFTVFAQAVVGYYKRCSCGKHSIGEYQCLPCEIWRACIFNVDVEAVPFVVLSVGGDKCVLCAVEKVEYSLVQRQSGAQYGRCHYL